MSQKRRADIEINRDNWDDELPQQEIGTFKKADRNEIASRKILRASSNRISTTDPDSAPPDPQKSANESKYLQELRTLNHNLLDWIKKHIEEDPHCILSPIFADYDKHICALNEEFPNIPFKGDIHQRKESFESTKVNGKMDRSMSSSSSDKESSLPVSVASKFGVLQGNPEKLVADKPTFSFGSNFGSSTNPASEKPAFCFGAAPGTSKDFVAEKPTFTFGIPPSNNSSVPSFKFGSFPSVSSVPPLVSADNDDDSEEYVPPKPEVNEIKEDGSVYTVRCKLFYKEDNDWRERGVGNLFIKPTDGSKFQLLVRADTNLGTILLNILVTQDLPFKLQKNNVTFVCVPSPPLLKSGKTSADKSLTDDSPVPMLIRVKTAEGASELLAQFDKHRGIDNA